MPAGHQLAAIMFTDVVGYTSIMGKDEVAAIALLKQNRQLHQSAIDTHQGRLLQIIGDGMLASFPSVTDAIDAAQKILKEARTIEDLQIRIGIHLGEVVFDKDDVFGDGVNIAARIEPLAPSGGILVSEPVYHNIKNKKDYHAEFLFEKSLKNVDHPIKLYQIKSNDTTSHKAVIPANSLAVLPFVNMSNDPDQEYFCEGISEEIINTIVQVPQIKVAGRTSSFSFKDKKLDLRQVGDQLGVSKVLEGSVRKFGNRIRITAQLIEATSGFHIWSNRYDRELDDIFRIQDDISQEIAKHLQKTIIGEKSVPKSREQTDNIEAYELYLKGRSLYYKRGEALWESLECFKQALNIDPGYALAASALAENNIMLSFHGYLHPAKCWEEAIPAANKAIHKGPELGESHSALAIISLLHDRNLKTCQHEFENALEINPNHIQARCWYGLFYLITAIMEYDKGLSQLNKAVEIDPLSSYAASCYALGLSVTGDYERSLIWAEKAIDLDPDALVARYTIGFCYQWADELSKSIEQYQFKAVELSSKHSIQLGLLLQAYLKAGQPDLADKIYQELNRRYKEQYVQPSILAQSAAAMGDADRAIALAQEAVEIIDPYLSNIMTNYPEATALRSLPGFKDIVKQFGYGQTSG